MAWAASRVVALTGLVTGAWWRGRGVLAGFAPRTGFACWDGQWYLRAARRGYGGAPLPGHASPWPFFPMLPLVLRLLHRAGLPPAAGMVVVDHALLLVAMVGVWYVAERHLGPSYAPLAVWGLALAPMAGVFSMLYPSALFLAGSVWAFELADRRRWVGCGALAAAVTLARPNGIVIAVVLVVVAWRRGAPGGRWRDAAVVASPSLAALGGWMLVGLVRTGNPIVFATAKTAWHEITLLGLVRRALSPTSFDSLDVHVIIGAVAVIALAIGWRHLPRSWRALAGVSLALPAVTGLVGLGRYSTECFPVAIAASVPLSRLTPRTRWFLAAGSGAAAFACAVAMAAHGLVP